MGTVHYLSPEQAQGQPATQASDVYAIGVVLYEMVTGRVPFDGASPEEIVLKQIQQEPLPPHLINGRLPLALEGFVLKALAKDPAKRYASAREMGSALQAYRQMGEGRTMPYRPVVGGQPPVASRQPAAAGGQQPAVKELARTESSQAGNQPISKPVERPAAAPRVTPYAPRPSSSAGGLDCLLVLLIIIALACVAGLVPLSFMVRDALTVPTPTLLPEVTVPNLVGLE